jgi:hypothetical protein
VRAALFGIQCVFALFFWGIVIESLWLRGVLGSLRMDDQYR